jgi:dTDP-4-amino-4,6-dideoxygalactose transaminase
MKVSKGDSASRVLEALTRRKLSLLGRTTTLTDALIALRFLLFPYHLVDGEGITEFEQAFARVVGTRYTSSLSAGRIGLYGLLKAL